MEGIGQRGGVRGAAGVCPYTEWSKKERRKWPPKRSRFEKAEVAQGQGGPRPLPISTTPPQQAAGSPDGWNDE